MNSWQVSTLIFLGAGVGANARYWVGVWIVSQLGSDYPWPTLAVNVSGSLLLGAFVGLATRHELAAGWWLLIAIGLLGGYTTFSTFSYETLSLLREARYAAVASNITLNVALSLLAAFLGLTLTRHT